ncbi:MAG: alpha/beta hydrolase [Rickettsiales bacterium]|nr:alpha/beta hydrolase [Rickettsiales bacterium]OUV79608.1 MAG: hypothetical protein CBC91_03455 [Rickettsiales bacterium TMED131]|tara:strand:+ start:3590 stop:4681 length:1092 start_codon:yes stop_codon:yes gene_type:complete
MKNYPNLKYKLITNVNGLDINVLENTVKKKDNNTIIMLHGFPEISYSFRYLIELFTKKGYYCIAPDQRGYGKTRCINSENLNSYSVLNLSKDIICLMDKLGITKFHIIGHDFGSYIASYISILYPKYILSLTLMSMPFAGIPEKKNINSLYILNKKLAKFKKKHYQYYFSSIQASNNILNCKQGLKKFLRGYYYFKSNDYKKNKPFKLNNSSVREISKMPEYYIMQLHLGMSQTIKKFMPTVDEINNCQWLDQNDLEVYVRNFTKSGFRKALYWYKVMLSDKEKLKIINLSLPKSITIPAIFIAGKADWGIYQKPGDLEKMESRFFKNYYGTKLIVKAGHWVQQEQPLSTFKEIIHFYNILKN